MDIDSIAAEGFSIFVVTAGLYILIVKSTSNMASWPQAASYVHASVFVL